MCCVISAHYEIMIIGNHVAISSCVRGDMGEVVPWVYCHAQESLITTYP